MIIIMYYFLAKHQHSAELRIIYYAQSRIWLKKFFFFVFELVKIVLLKIIFIGTGSNSNIIRNKHTLFFNV